MDLNLPRLSRTSTDDLGVVHWMWVGLGGRNPGWRVMVGGCSGVAMGMSRGGRVCDW